jgi:hypothetical protein
MDDDASPLIQGHANNLRARSSGPLRNVSGPSRALVRKIFSSAVTNAAHSANGLSQALRGNLMQCQDPVASFGFKPRLLWVRPLEPAALIHWEFGSWTDVPCCPEEPLH